MEGLFNMIKVLIYSTFYPTPNHILLVRQSFLVGLPDDLSRPNARLYLFGQVPFGTGRLAGRYSEKRVTS